MIGAVGKQRNGLLPYYGGKGSYADWIGGLLPTTVAAYVEPFGGMAAVLLRRPKPARGRPEVYNDLDGALVNLFRVVRDRALCEELVWALRWTLHSRAEHELAQAGWPETPPKQPCVESARRVAVTLMQSFSACPRPGVSWRRPGVATDSARLARRSQMDRIAWACERLQHTTVECRPWERVVDDYDTPDTLFYIDPPYLAETRPNYTGAYRVEMHDEDAHRSLLARLAAVEGAVAISGYPSSLYDELLGSWDVQRHRTRASAMRGENLPRAETLWRNARCVELLGAEGLFA